MKKKLMFYLGRWDQNLRKLARITKIATVIILVTLVQVNAFADAEQKSVSGTVTEESGAPLPGVTVVIKGTTQGAVTDLDGKYIITSVPNDATLQFSFVGMTTQEVEVGNQTSINITLLADAIGLEEVEGYNEAFGVDLFYIKDLDVWIEGLGKWKDMRLAFRDKDLIIDNHNTVFFEPENEDERKRGYRL